MHKYTIISAEFTVDAFVNGVDLRGSVRSRQSVRSRSSTIMSQKKKSKRQLALEVSGLGFLPFCDADRYLIVIC